MLAAGDTPQTILEGYSWLEAELDFIFNYDIMCRMGRDVEDEE